MDWFSGAIPVAIQKAKTQKSVFVVYISGSDDLSKEMDSTWNNSTVTEMAKSTDIVAIKLDAQSDACAQFSAIYPVVTVPAIYFIGNNGKPIEVVVGTKSADELSQMIEQISETNASGQNTKPVAAAPSAPFTSETTQVTKETTPVTTETSPMETVVTSETAASTSTLSAEEKVKRARELMEQKRIEKAEKEKEGAKSKEKERREVGRNLGQLRQWKDEHDAKEVQDQMKKDKEEDRKAKERVKAQIAKDREERHRRFAKEKDDRDKVKEEARIAKLRQEQEAKDRAAAQKSSVARIQFRMTDGSSVTEQFPPSATLDTVRQFIAQTMNRSTATFRLCISYPRREFTQDDMGQSLAELGLAPSASIMVLPPARGTVSRQSAANSRGYLYMLVAPLIALWNFFYVMLFGGATTRASSGSSQGAGTTAASTSSPQSSQQYSQQSQSNPRKRPAVSRRDGNVHRLTREDDDDEMNTWNGNSTQQL